MAGYTDSNIRPGAIGYDAWVFKLDENGNIQWQKTYGGQDSGYARSVRQTSDGGYIVAGNTNSFGAGNDDIWLIKLDLNGNIQWQKTFGGAGSETAKAVQQTPDHGYIVLGWTIPFGTGHLDVWLLKLDVNGNIQWQKT